MKFKVTGTQKLQAALLDKAKAAKIKDVVKTTVTEMQQEAMSKASSVYVKRYSTGATKKSVGIGFKDGGLSGIVGLGMEYNLYTELGTRFMAAEPLLTPIYKDRKSKFLADIKRLTK